jgi:cyclopropane fatty-acyl-phospholipid synthase-like methyltransferase
MPADSPDEGERARQREIVRAGYDAISFEYRDDDGQAARSSPEATDHYEEWIAELGALLHPGDRVLDLGCGAGVPTARLLVEHGFRVTGVDISAIQIERAKRLVPSAMFLQADMATWEPNAESFEAIVSLYALIHVPLADQQQLIPRLARWLSRGGLLLATVGHQRWTGTEDYFGAEMFWDHADVETYKVWLRDAGFTIEWDRFIAEGSSGHSLVLARTSESDAPEATQP